MGILETIKNIFRNNLTTNSSINKSSAFSEYSMAIFLNWADGKALGKSSSDYPQYIKYECKIDNPIKYHKEMICNGYLCSPPIEKALKLYKVPDLKQLLSGNNLSTTGTKQILIQRILDNIPTENLEILRDSINNYVLSQQGTIFVNRNKAYIEIHKNSNWMISLNEYTKKKNELTFDASFYDVAWGIFVDRNIEYSSQHNWGLVRNNILNMSELLYKRNDITNSLSFLLSVLYYDLSGLGNNNILYNYNEIKCAPGIIERILKMKDNYHPDMIDKCPFLDQLPFAYFSVDTFKIVVSDLINDGKIDLNKYKNYTQKQARAKRN